MANHQSSIKRIRQAEKKRVHNKYYGRTTRTALKEIRSTNDKDKATEMLPKVTAMLDKLAKKNIIHRKKANNLKSKITRRVNQLA